MNVFFISANGQLISWIDQWGTWLSAYVPFSTRNGQKEGVLGIDMDATRLITQERNLLNVSIVMFVVLLPLSLLFGWLIGRWLLSPVNAMMGAATQLSRGEVDDTFEQVYQQKYRRRKDELGQTLAAFDEMQRYLRDMATASEEIASGNLNITITPHSEKDLLGHSFANMVHLLNSALAEVRESAETLALSSQSMTQVSITCIWIILPRLT